MDSYRAIDCYTKSCKLLFQHSVHLQSNHKTSRNQKRKQVITKALPFATFCSLKPERRGQLQGIKAPFPGCKVPSPKAMLASYRTCWGQWEWDSPLQTRGAASKLHPFVSLHPLSETYFFDVDKLADIHVIISVLDIRPYSLNYLADHRDNDIPPGE